MLPSHTLASINGYPNGVSACVPTGGIPASDVDGVSLVPLLLKGAATGSNRQDFLVDYYGEGKEGTGIYGDGTCEVGVRGGRVPLSSCGDAWNNTYHCVRQLITPQTETTLTRLYCEFMDDENFRELYTMKNDPWQLTNMAYSNSSDNVNIVKFMAERLNHLRSCSGSSCHGNATSA